MELGAKYYFNKSAKGFRFSTMCIFAGINSSPNSYNPFDESKDQEKVKENIKKKVLTVLKEMKDQGYITNDDDYNNAVAEAEAGLVFTKGNVESATDYSYHTDAALKANYKPSNARKKNVSREFAEKYVYSSGLVIYTTEDPTIQATVEQEFSKTKYQLKGHEKDKNGSLKMIIHKAGMAIIDYKKEK